MQSSLSLPFTSKKGHSFTKNQTINFIVNGSEDFKEKRERMVAQLYDAAVENEHLQEKIQDLEDKVFWNDSMTRQIETLEGLVLKLSRMISNFQDFAAAAAADTKKANPEVAKKSYLEVAKTAKTAKTV